VTAKPAGQATAPVVHGIDFGTSTSMIMVGRAGDDPVLIRDPLAEYGQLGFPTSVCVRRDGSLAVGVEAERIKLMRIQDYRTGFKLEMGQPVIHRLGSTDYSPDGLMAEVIRFLRERALAEVPTEPELVVVTVPVAWEEWTRDLTVRACVTAGYDPARVRLETEPVAALAGLGAIPGRTVVYDLGGGTFDCVVALDAGDGPRIFSAPFGLPQVGGRAFDDRVLRHVRDTFPQAEKVFAAATEVTDGVLRQRIQLREKCTEAKVALSFRPFHETLLSELDPAEPLELERSVLDRLIGDLVEQTVNTCEEMLRSVDQSWPDIDRYVLIGGSSRVPLAQERMRERSGRPITVPPEPELAVVRGAAALALDLMRPAAPPKPDPRLDPNSGANRVMLRNLAKGAGRTLADRVRRQLAEAAASGPDQAKAGLTQLDADLARQVSEEEARLTAKRGKQAKEASTRARQHEDFLEAVGRDVRNVLARQRGAAEGAVRATTAMVDGAARAENFYGQDLTSRLQVIAGTTAADITAAIAAQARRYGQAAPAAAAQPELATLLAPPPIAVVADRPASLGKSVAVGAGTGLAAGTVVPILGHAVGLVVGGVAGGVRAKAARVKQLSALQDEVRQAGEAAVTAMFGSADAVIALVTSGYPGPAAPSEPDQGRLACLREAREHLSGLAAALTDTAAAAGGGRYTSPGESAE
jgi:actin-like ATPase involved in cell morphogenesis